VRIWVRRLINLGIAATGLWLIASLYLRFKTVALLDVFDLPHSMIVLVYLLVLGRSVIQSFASDSSSPQHASTPTSAPTPPNVPSPEPKSRHGMDHNPAHQHPIEPLEVGHAGSKATVKKGASEIDEDERATSLLNTVLPTSRLPDSLTRAMTHVEDPRFPALAFFEDDIEVESNIALPPLRNGHQLDLRFWIDVGRQGIPPRGGHASIRSPISYPVRLEVNIYSEGFRFSKYKDEVILNENGATNQARFTVESTPPFRNRGDVFIFVQHSTELVAAFRVEALISDQSDSRAPQQLDNIYLATDWFKFPDVRSPALTLLFRKKDGNLQIFTLRPGEKPWATLGANESGLYEHNKAIYQELHELARRASEREQEGKVVNFALEEFKSLANLGYQLFTDLFCSNDDSTLYDSFLKNLPNGAPITIVTTSEAQNLYIPWGFVYESRPPLAFSESAHCSSFWGYRYDLVVRPSVTPVVSGDPVRLPVRLGAAWLEHSETEKLRTEFATYPPGLLELQEIRVMDYSIPSLAEHEFELIEFFCHGHTQLNSVFSPAEAKQLLKNFADSGLKTTTEGLLMAIESSTDSLIEMNGGFATLSALKDTLKHGLKGNPLILLSMCESAQVSASGGGFVSLFLQRGARAVIGTEGPTLWSLSRAMDIGVVAKLIGGLDIRRAFYETRFRLAQKNALALIYTLYGDPDAKLI
jgi:hypothetical protein